MLEELLFDLQTTLGFPCARKLYFLENVASQVSRRITHVAFLRTRQCTNLESGNKLRYCPNFNHTAWATVLTINCVFFLIDIYLHGAGVWNFPCKLVRDLSVYFGVPSAPWRVTSVILYFGPGPSDCWFFHVREPKLYAAFLCFV